MLTDLAQIRHARTGRFSSWEKNGRNRDCWDIPAGSSRVLADIKVPRGSAGGCMTHIWMTQTGRYRECLLKITFDNARSPSVLVPLGDFFGLGHGIVNSYQSLLFTASTASNNAFNRPCALNAYVPMPFHQRAVVELINQSKATHVQYFYFDYELYDEPREDLGYFHAEVRRANPFGGWGHEISVNHPEANVVNKERQAYDHNYVILDTNGRGHYIGCNMSITNFQGTWWGEGDDMIWVDGYKWPPDIHGTGSEDYLNQAYGMQDNAFARNGSSIHERNTNGYQTSYVHHLENPVHFTKSVKVTIEHGHGNHLANEVSSVAYWYAQKPTKVATPPPVAKRMAVARDNQGKWLYDKRNQCPGPKVKLTPEMRRMKTRWKKR